MALLLLLFSVSAFSLTFRQDVWDSIETDVTTIEWNIQKLQTENSSLQTQLTNVSSLLDEQKVFSAAQAIQLETCEKNLKQSERNMKLWRSGCLVSVAILLVILISK